MLKRPLHQQGLSTLDTTMSWLMSTIRKLISARITWRRDRISFVFIFTSTPWIRDLPCYCNVSLWGCYSEQQFMPIWLRRFYDVVFTCLCSWIQKICSTNSSIIREEEEHQRSYPSHHHQQTNKRFRWHYHQREGVCKRCSQLCRQHLLLTLARAKQVLVVEAHRV